MCSLEISRNVQAVGLIMPIVYKLQLISSDRCSRKIIKMRNIEHCERRSMLNKTMRSTTKFHPPLAKRRAEEQSYGTPGLIKYMTRNNVVDIRVLIRKRYKFRFKNDSHELHSRRSHLQQAPPAATQLL